MSTLAHFPVNPAFGTGIYRRRLRFVAHDAGVAAQVSDDYHGYWLDLRHDGEVVTAIDAGFRRSPTEVCAGSTLGLKALVGLRLDEPVRDVLARLPAPGNCTHLADLTLWAIAHVGRSAVWDIAVPDQGDGPVWISIARDGDVVHRWQIADYHIVAPDTLRDQPMLSGFKRWADASLSGEALQAATMLQRGVFVARGRKYIVDRLPATPLTQAGSMSGMCWAYSGERFETAYGSIDYVRDFTAGMEMDEVAEPLARHFRKMES